jgi:hypothetical protein
MGETYLKSIKNDVIIIAVDTVYKFLKRNAISPDIIVTIDPQYWNYKYLEDEYIKQSIIVTDANVYPKIFDIGPIENYFTGSSIFPITKYFEKDNKERGNLCAGGSVSTTAFDIARIIGAKDIILLGLDLSFPNRMTHFKGAFFETRFLNIQNYFNTPDHAEYNYLTHVDLQVIEATNGKVFTDQKMFLFKKWFDREIPLTNANVYLPDLGGALLEGTKIFNFNENINYSKIDKSVFNNKKEKLFKLKKEINIKCINEKINLIINKSDQIKNTCKKIVKLIPEDGTINPQDEKKINQLEAYLYGDNERKEVTNIISSSAQDILLSIMENKEYSEDEKTSAWIKTRILYQSIYNLTDFYKKSLTKSLKIS